MAVEPARVAGGMGEGMTDREHIEQLLSGARVGVSIVVCLPFGDVPTPDDVLRYGDTWVYEDLGGALWARTLETDGTDVYVVSGLLPGGRSKINQQHPTQRWGVMFRRKSDVEV